MTTWFCSECGGNSTAVAPAHPSVDDRYAIGYCVHCSPEPVQDLKDPTKTKPVNRKTVQLVRSDIWDPGLLAARREQARIRRLFNGKARLTATDQEEVRALRRKWDAEAAERRTPA